MRIEIVEYNPAWPAMARMACQQVAAALPGVFQAIEHIGSTSVPGLAAKPILDLMAMTTDLELVTSQETKLEPLGYQRVDSKMSQRLFYPRDVDGRRMVHLHVVLDDNWELRHERLLRDHLRASPADAARYAELKRDLAAAGYVGDAYTRAKTDLIQELTDRARAARGLPSVPVWEE